MSRKKLSDVEQAFLASSATPQSAQQPQPQPTQQQPSTPTSLDDAMRPILSPRKSADKEPSTRFTADLPDSLH
jgi:hypothetical protein